MASEEPAKGEHYIADDLADEKQEERFVEAVELYLAKVTELQRRFPESE